MRKLADQNTRKLVRLGKASLAVTIPKEMTTALGWREKQKLTVKKIKGGIVIREHRKK